ncbi:LamG-like jellyroll fold domain-containing protein, partial [Planktotalea sp.]
MADETDQQRGEIFFMADATAQTTITVSSSEELRAAYLELQANEGGGVIKLQASDTPYSMYFRDVGDEQNAVTITSEDPDTPAIMSRVYIRDTDNITIDNVLFDSTGDSNDSSDDLEIYSSDNISITNSEFIGNATGFVTSYSEVGLTLGSVRWSDEFNFSGNTVSNYYHGLSVIDGDDIVVSDNDITQMQGDGLRFASVQGVEVTDNTLHDFYGTSQNVTHSDMIQFWGTNANQITRDVVISGNVLNTSGGAGSQGIFIRNELFGDGGATGGYFENFEISNNVIYNSHIHGIYAADVNDLSITNNTLLWNRQAEVVTRDNEISSSAPSIVIRNDGDVVITNNITNEIAGTTEDVSVIRDNFFVEYDDVNAANHIINNFVNANDGGAADLRDLRFLLDSDWNGLAGADLTQATLSAIDGVEAVLTRSADIRDIYTMSFDARLSLDSTGFVDLSEYQFVWSFSDGSTFTGIEIDKSVGQGGSYEVTLTINDGGTVVDQISRDFLVATKDIIYLKSSNGLADLSEKQATVLVEGNVEGSHDGFHISLGNEIEITSGAFPLQKSGTIGITLDMKWADAGNGGNFITLHTIFQGRVYDDGRVWFEIVTDEGAFAVITETPVLSDGDWHNIGISYDAYDEKLGLYVDGEEAASVTASGITGSSSQDLVFGNVFDRDTADIYIDDIAISRDPAIADEPVTIDVPNDDPIIGEEPVVASAFLRLSSATGLTNLAEGDARIYNTGTVEGDYTGFNISKSSEIFIDSDTDSLQDMEGLALTLNMRLESLGSAGNFINYYEQFAGSVKDDGRVWFEVETTTGTYAMISDRAIFDDGDWHSIGIFYDSDAETLVMRADGVEVASVTASGIITGARQDLVLGNLWSRDTVDAYIDDIQLSDRSISIDVPVGDADAIALLSSSQGLADQSGSGITVYQTGETLGSHVGFRISESSEIYLNSDTGSLQDMDGFDLRLDLRLAEADAAGNFINYY